MAQENGLGKILGLGIWMGRGIYKIIALTYGKIKKPRLQNGKQSHKLDLECVNA